ncbi:hypothetical protein HPB51_015752 [Rhipicephalus microplus]|uniref:Uncharacterized protein n=1 Tax=Rhipicephalus microplus TaxID=6941 RepID=A0A9J6ET86_RHIMP|nr:hypothetical protein HPB51_015752 [Rhipicephalus microplus]
MGLSDPVLPPQPGASSVEVGDTLCPGDRLKVAAMHDPNTRKAEKVKGRLLPAGAITFRAQSFNFRLWRLWLDQNSSFFDNVAGWPGSVQDSRIFDNSRLQVCQGVIDSKFGRLASAENKRDDLIRKTLSVLEDSIAATSPVAKVMFSGMSTLGGPRGWDRESVVSSVRDWVTGETTLFSGEGQRCEIAALRNDWMSKWVGQGVLGDARKLGFEEYSRDFVRWGTPGGCSPTQRELQYAINNGIISDKSERVGLRTKTICGMLSVLVGDSDDLLKKSDICHAALKEETKMCVIISTPMWSYVHMCYILHCLQKPAFLSSTLSRHDMMV